ncbi:MAG: molybdopterin molybdenumtransferase MoeA, partial [Actinomycetes bacterium]
MTSHSHGTADHARSVAGHRAAVTDLLAPLAAESRAEVLPLADALGRSLVHGLLAPLSLPPFANSQMDGYAVNSADIPDGGADLHVMAPVPAGATPQPLEPGTAAPIMTGAMIPVGADAVVPIEKAVPDHFPAPGSGAGTGATVRLPATAPGTYVRPAGSDIAAGERALAAGTFLGPAQLGLLAALGLPEVAVYKAVTVLLVTTG